MTVLIPAEGPFYHQDGSFLGVSGQSAALVIQLQQPQEEGPPVAQNLDGRLFAQRILDGAGATLLEIIGVNRPAGEVLFSLSSANTTALLPPDGVAARDLTHVVGELVLEGFTPVLTAPFSLRRLRRGVGATVLSVQPGEDVVIVRYAGAPPLSLLEELIAAGDLPSDATHDDMLEFLRNYVADARETALGAIATALANALTAIGADNASGVRGGAITAITNQQATSVTAVNTARDNALAAIGADDASGARGAALTAIANQQTLSVTAVNTAKDNALAAIGADNASGARGGAITAVNTAKDNALTAIGADNASGARGGAITAITNQQATSVTAVNTARDNALAAIGADDASGARGAALTAIANQQTLSVTAVGAAGTVQINLINAAGTAQLLAIATAALKGVYALPADGISKGVASYASLVGGNSGTNGTFDLAFTGGAGTGAAGRFTVAGGAVTSIIITASGRGYTSAPAISFAASAGLTGASATAVIANNADVGEYFFVSIGNGKLALYRVDAGPTATMLGVVASMSSTDYSLARAWYDTETASGLRTAPTQRQLLSSLTLTNVTKDADGLYTWQSGGIMESEAKASGTDIDPLQQHYVTLVDALGPSVGEYQIALYWTWPTQIFSPLASTTQPAPGAYANHAANTYDGGAHARASLTWRATRIAAGVGRTFPPRYADTDNIGATDPIRYNEVVPLPQLPLKSFEFWKRWNADHFIRQRTIRRMIDRAVDSVLGFDGTATATGSITGNTFAPTAGTWSVGMVLSGGTTIPGTRIETGAGLSWQVTPSQTVAAGTVITGVTGNSAYSTKKTLAGSAAIGPLYDGTVLGLKYKSLFRERLTQLRTTSHPAWDKTVVGYGGSGNDFPIITAFDPIPTGSITPVGDGTYTYNFNKTDSLSLIQIPGYDLILIVEIDRALVSAGKPIEARNLLTVVGGVGGLATAGTSRVVDNGGGNFDARFRPTGNAAINTLYDYEIITRWSVADFGEYGNYHAGFSNVWMDGSSHGYGPIASPSKTDLDLCVVSGMGTHGGVVANGTVRRSLFWGKGADKNALTFYANDGSGDGYGVEECMFMECRNPTYSHIGVGSSHDFGYDRNSYFIYGRRADGSLRGDATGGQSVVKHDQEGGYIRGFFSNGQIGSFTDPVVSSLTGRLIRQCGWFRTRSKTTNNLVLLENPSDTANVNARFPSALVMQNGDTADQDTIVISNVANALGDYQAQIFAAVVPTAGAPWTARPVVRRQLIIVNTPLSIQGTLLVTLPSTGVSDFDSDYNVFVFLKGSGFTVGQSGGATTSTWAQYLSRTGQDSHSIMIDARDNPLGIDDIFEDFANGNLTRKRSKLSQQIVDACKAVGGAGCQWTINGWPEEPSGPDEFYKWMKRA